MRRPHVYERSVPRVRRDAHHAPEVDPAGAARAVSRGLPPLVAIADAAGLSTLAEMIEAARREADRLGATPASS